MAGLSRGLDEGWDDVTRQLSGYVPTINGGGSLAGNGIGGTVINHNYYVTPQQLVDLMTNAKAGGDFARQFGPELAMMEGVG